jgi:hypothetical protein
MIDTKKLSFDDQCKHQAMVVELRKLRKLKCCKTCDYGVGDACLLNSEPSYQPRVCEYWTISQYLEEK